MRTKCMLCLMALLLMLGFTSSVSAISDTAGDERVAGYDIIGADIVVFPPATTPPTYMKAGLNMDNKMPGIVILEFDVDDDTTGVYPSIVGILNPCVGGPKLKIQPGIDIMCTLILRDQADDASTAWCAGCMGPAVQCAERAAACTGCAEADCYTIGASCDAGDPNCYERGDACTGCVEPECVVMNVECGLTVPCEFGKIRGEWSCIISVLGTGAGTFCRGRIETPLPVATDDPLVSEDCYQLPWADIVTRAIAADAGNNSFDYAKAVDPAFLKYQLSAWISLTNPQDDFMNTTIPCLEVSDVVPDTGLASARQGWPDCVMNPNGDQGVDAIDVGVFLSEFGRAIFFRPCAVCVNQ